jgi:rare lipoprotein A (peptidoglycan hydrolase)
VHPRECERRESCNRAGMFNRSALFVLPLIAAACSSTSSFSDGTTSSGVGGFPGCHGSYNSQPSPTGQYYATDFGCSSNPYYTDPTDTCGSAACIASAYDQGVCSSSQSHASCQRTVNWYSIGAARYGCGTRLEVTNPHTHKSVVVMVLDNGPSCYVENKADFWVIDVSYPTIKYLFGEEEGYSDHALVDVTVVDSSTPLGPTDGQAPPPPPPPPPPQEDAGSSGTDCSSDGDCNPGNDGSGMICTDGFCVDGCNANWQCPGVTTCVGGQCR